MEAHLDVIALDLHIAHLALGAWRHLHTDSHLCQSLHPGVVLQVDPIAGIGLCIRQGTTSLLQQSARNQAYCTQAQGVSVHRAV